MPKVEYQKEMIQNITIIRNLLILLLEKFEVKRIEIAEMLGVTPGQLSKILNPKKYKNKSLK